MRNLIIILFCFSYITLKSQNKKNKNTVSIELDTFKNIKSVEDFKKNSYLKAKINKNSSLRESVKIANQSKKKPKVNDTVRKVLQMLLNSQIQIKGEYQDMIQEDGDGFAMLSINEDREIEGENVVYQSTYKKLNGPSQYDSRIEVFQLNPEINWQYFMLLANESIAMLIEKKNIVKISNEYYKIETETNKSKDVLNLCEKLPFGNQPVIGVGTTFLVKGNQFMTAKHVIQRNIKDYVVVFGIDQLDSKITNSLIPKEDIFFPNKIVNNLNDIDVLTFNVDREINRSPLVYGKSKELKVRHWVYSIGHPSGLPKKIALNASILNNNNFQYFYTSLDTFQGNSGSPVFDFYTNSVIGILVAGETDYIFNGSCYELNTCSYPKCKGEKVIRIEEVLSRIKN